MHYLQALNKILQGKKNNTPQEELAEAAQVINTRANRMRLWRLKRLGYTEEEAKALIYTPPAETPTP